MSIYFIPSLNQLDRAPQCTQVQVAIDGVYQPARRVPEQSRDDHRVNALLLETAGESAAKVRRALGDTRPRARLGQRQVGG